MTEQAENMTPLHRSSKKINRLIVGALVSFAVGCVLLQSYSGMLSALGMFLSFVIAPFLGILACIVSFKRNKVIRIVLIVILVMIALVHARFFVVIVLPYIYLPPALNSQNIEVYDNCVSFLRSHNGYKFLALNNRGFLSLDGQHFLMRTLPDHKQILASHFSPEEISETKQLAQELTKIMCVKFQRRNNVIIFYKTGNSFFPMVVKEFYSIFPTGRGVVYSLNGHNPNDVDDEVLNRIKPFVNICGNWYAYKALFLTGHRADSTRFVDKTLIDHTLLLDSIDRNELHRFE